MQDEAGRTLGWATKRPTRLQSAPVNVLGSQQTWPVKRQKPAWTTKEDRKWLKHAFARFWLRPVTIQRVGFSTKLVELHRKNTRRRRNNQTSVWVSGCSLSHRANYKRRRQWLRFESERSTAHFQPEEQVYHCSGTRTDIHRHASRWPIFQRSTDESLCCNAILLLVLVDVLNCDFRQIWTIETRFEQ